MSWDCRHWALLCGSPFVLVHIAPERRTGESPEDAKHFGSTPDTGGAGGGLIWSRQRDEYFKIKDYLG